MSSSVITRAVRTQLIIKLRHHAYPFPIWTVFANWRCKQQGLYF